MLAKFTVCNSLDVCLNKITCNSKLAIAISHAHSRHSRLIMMHQYYCFDNSEIIHEYAVKFLVRKEFPYLKELNHFIQMTSSSGLIEKWRSEKLNRSTYKNGILDYLTFDHFVAFIILGILLWVCLIIFLFIERLVYPKCRENNPSKFWIIIEIIIDSHRHFMLENKYN